MSDKALYFFRADSALDDASSPKLLTRIALPAATARLSSLDMIALSDGVLVCLVDSELAHTEDSTRPALFLLRGFDDGRPPRAAFHAPVLRLPRPAPLSKLVALAGAACCAGGSAHSVRARLTTVRCDDRAPAHADHGVRRVPLVGFCRVRRLLRASQSSCRTRPPRMDRVLRIRRSAGAGRHDADEAARAAQRLTACQSTVSTEHVEAPAGGCPTRAHGRPRMSKLQSSPVPAPTDRA